MADDQRLERIENKLDTLSDAVVSLARMEERMVSLFKRMDKYDTMQADIAERISKLEQNVGANGQALRFAERIFWIVVAAGATYMFKSQGG